MDNHPVIFYQKSSIEEMLKKQKLRFHLASCHLPQLQSKKKKNRRNTEPPVKYRPSSKYSTKLMKLNENSLPNDRLELKGNGMERLHMKEFILNNSKNCVKHCTRMEMYGNELSLPDRGTGSQSNYLKSHSSMDISAESYLQISSKALKEYVNIPVSSNPALTEELCSIVSEARDLNSEVTFVGLDTDRCNETSNKVKSSPKHIKYFDDGTEKYSTNNKNESVEEKSVSEITIPHGKIGKERFTKRETNAGPGLTPRGSHEGRQSSRLTYTPSTPPLFLSDEIYELPKGVSASKALLELRQTFCENIRRETEQLEFDLQELYLKKQLHQR